MARYAKNGARIQVALPADTKAWTPILLNHKVYIPTADGLSGEVVECHGPGSPDVFEVTAGGAIGQLTNVKMNNTTKKWTVAAPDAGGATPGDAIHGIAWSAAGADGDLFLVKLA